MRTCRERERGHGDIWEDKGGQGSREPGEPMLVASREGEDKASGSMWLFARRGGGALRQEACPRRPFLPFVRTLAAHATPLRVPAAHSGRGPRPSLLLPPQPYR